MLKDDKFDNFSLGHFAVMNRMAPWQQRSATAYAAGALDSARLSSIWLSLAFCGFGYFLT
jgi:hypothetical protein